MIHIEDIHSLSEFQRNAKKHIDYVNETGRVEVITVNGEPGAVLMGKNEYANFLRQKEEIETLAAIEQSLAEFGRGEGIPASDVHDWLMKL